jgi:uncharacterized protein (DUF1778 family)
MRMDPRRKDKILRAAEVVGKDFSAFVTDAAEREAERVLDERAATWLPSAEFDRLMAMLDVPGEPLGWVRKVTARKRYRR